ncbi:MAG: alpha-glucan family phosphorylase [Bdellovibrionota bacterium]
MKKSSYLFEISWEVCNMVGGIHTVLMSKISAMQDYYGDRYVTVGPDVPRASGAPPTFREEIWDPEIVEAVSSLSVGCRMGRWLVPGEPRCLLIDFSSINQIKDQILADYWERYRLHSLYGGWDYLEPMSFSQAAGMAIEQIFQKNLKPQKLNAIVHCHEWMAAAAILHLRKTAPEVATVFTTHATMLGRSLSAHQKNAEFSSQHSPQQLEQLAHEMGVSAKHSMETIAARLSDCFTTVSPITSEECVRILNRKPDLLLLNGIGEDFLDSPLTTESARQKSRSRLFEIAKATTGFTYDPANTNILVSAGRYEFKNKGIDLLLDSLAVLNSNIKNLPPEKRVIAFLMFPAGHGGPRKPPSNNQANLSTHELRDEHNDPVIRKLIASKLTNNPDNRIHVVFVPIYLDGNDSLIKEKYYELLAAADISAFPSFYEPWGYTPMESISFGVPTITSDLAGFGIWAKDLGPWKKTGVFVLDRKECQKDEHSVQQLADHLLEVFKAPPKESQALKKAAHTLAKQASWSEWAKAYFKAHGIALKKALERTDPESTHNIGRISEGSRYFDPQTHMRKFTVLNQIPKNLEDVRTLARNIWWSWHPEAVQLFSTLDPELWSKLGHNPSMFLDYVKLEVLESASGSKKYMHKLKKVLSKLERHQMNTKAEPQIAFFCAEYGLASCLKFYSGGLGILAGDLLKTASDMKIPLCAIGLAYNLGYFRQRINRDGNQEHEYEKNDFYSMPMQPACSADGTPIVVSIPFPHGPVHARVWKVTVGNVGLYLLDTDFGANRAKDRAITNNLYGGDLTHRLKQEIILGIGGLKLLRMLGISPLVYHMNEGHSAFLVLARLVELVTQYKLEYHEAMEYIRQTSIFTTHTPVPAGHDQFPEEVIKPYLQPFGEALKKDWSSLLSLGNTPQTTDNRNFSMTYLCLHGSNRVNGVSQVHGKISRRMFREFYPDFHEFEVPIKSITNGVHVPTWLAPEWQQVFTKHIGVNWRKMLADKNFWKSALELDNKLVWQTHLAVKRRLIDWLRIHLEETFKQRREDPAHLAIALSNLDKDPLIMGFARRFAPYKRANLLFHNMARLEKLLSQGKPLIFLFSGKSHPSDGIGQALIRKVIEMSRQPQFVGKILFVENYDFEVAQLMVSGCDVWLNTPTRPLEASGTSGMKAGINGCINLSVADGWWVEGFNGKNGWIIADENQENPQDFQNEYDSARIYALLEHEIMPMFYDRSAAGVPAEWVHLMKESMASIIPRFSSARMLKEYNEQMYLPAVENANTLNANGFAALTELCEAKKRLTSEWSSIGCTNVRMEGLEREKVLINQPINIKIDLNHPNLDVGDLVVQAVLGRSLPDGRLHQLKAFTMSNISNGHSSSFASSWEAEISCEESGPYSIGIRVMPSYYYSGGEELQVTHSLVKWL